MEPRRARHYARGAAAAGFVVAVAIALGVVLGNWIALGVVLAAFAVRAVVIRWQARPHRGNRAHWPVGDLRPGPEGVTDVDHYSDRAARYGAVFKCSFYERPACCIVDLETASAVLREHTGDFAPPWDPPGRFVPGGSIRGSEGSHSAELRLLYARSLTAGLVRSWEPAMSLRMTDWLATWTAGPGAATNGVAARTAIRASVRALWCELFLGVEPYAPEFAEVDSLVRLLDPDLHLYSEAIPDAEIEAGLERLAELIRAARVRRDRSLVAVTWADSFDAERPGALVDPALVRNLIYSTVTSYDDVAGLLAWVLWYLVGQPQWVERVRSDPDDARDVADRIVSETLRLAQSEFVIREARVDVPVGDSVIPKGWLMRACIRESHRDAAKFSSPEVFDPDRFAAGIVSRNRYSPFGLDHRSCLGEQVTRAAGREFVLAVAFGFDVDSLCSGPVELGEKRHWAPSSGWLVRLHTREPRVEHT